MRNRETTTSPDDIQLHIERNGREETVAFSKNAQWLHLASEGIEHVDLSPLSTCATLQNIDLRGNELQNIDLSALSSCASLGHLALGSNKLHSIDLSPLSSCKALHGLDLWENQIQSIDLSPLSSCARLERLGLYENRIQSIDLGPLSACVGLKTLTLDRNGLESIDLAPLSFHNNLDSLGLSSNKLQSIDLSPLSSCTSLQSLFLKDNLFTEIDTTPLRSCERLHTVQFDSGVVDKDIYAHWSFSRPEGGHAWPTEEELKHADQMFFMLGYGDEKAWWEYVVETLRERTRADPKNAGAWYNLGAILLRIGDRESGCSALREALKYADANAELLNMIRGKLEGSCQDTATGSPGK